MGTAVPEPGKVWGTVKGDDDMIMVVMMSIFMIMDKILIKHPHPLLVLGAMLLLGILPELDLTKR